MGRGVLEAPFRMHSSHEPCRNYTSSPDIKKKKKKEGPLNAVNTVASSLTRTLGLSSSPHFFLEVIPEVTFQGRHPGTSNVLPLFNYFCRLLKRYHSKALEAHVLKGFSFSSLIFRTVHL